MPKYVSRIEELEKEVKELKRLKVYKNMHCCPIKKVKSKGIFLSPFFIPDYALASICHFICLCIIEKFYVPLQIMFKIF